MKRLIVLLALLNSTAAFATNLSSPSPLSPSASQQRLQNQMSTQQQLHSQQLHLEQQNSAQRLQQENQLHQQKMLRKVQSEQP
ncbi:hypothetical protein SAMN05216522_11064 [Rosenbergiella nectarea]|uniref:DUF2756 domain-containing protein n=1 Tax=Rosenbergiella nectarea TaxID=988801 RepID=A0A1H9KW24_9GAMM|nr:hypothetical protein [Rosenbergiella nectarea]SER03392.1 hypothetical protein SAMN05216522_11064 [Rosenbergiella nectarea]